MTYRDLLKLYREGKLLEEQRKKVESDIERQEAIGDYLFDREEIPGLEVLSGKKESKGLREDTDAISGERAGKGTAFSSREVCSEGDSPFDYREETEFISIVNRSIRRAFLKMGLLVLAVTLCIILFVQFVLPGLVSSFYYDPAENIGTEDNMMNKMSRDMAVYSELFLPGKQRQSVSAEAEGYGVYNIRINQSYSLNGRTTDVSGRIVRNKLIYYDSNILSRPATNVFVWSQIFLKPGSSLSENLKDEESGEDNVCAAGSRANSLELLEDLDDNSKYLAYVSLDSMMNYEEFKEYIDKQDLLDVWCAVQTEDFTTYEDGSEGVSSCFQGNNTGFICSPATFSVNYWDNEKYPELLPGCEEENFDAAVGADSSSVEEDMKKENYAATHFTSLLRYMADQGRFLSIMNGEDYDELALESLREEADYVEENGIKVYGYVVTVNKKEAIKLSEQKEVYEIYTEEVR